MFSTILDYDVRHARTGSLEAVQVGFPKFRDTFWGSVNKDYNILGSILASPYFGKLPNPSGISVLALGFRVGLQKNL